MSDLVERVRKTMDERTTVWALATLLLAVTPVALYCLRALEWAGTSLGLVAPPMANEARAIVVIGVFIFAWLAIVIRWLLWRGVPTVRRAATGVLFAASAAEEVHALVRRLHIALVSQIAKQNPKGLVRTYLLPKNQAITTREEATRALDVSGARLIVWGTVGTGTLSGKNVAGFKSVNFTMRHRPLESSELPGVCATLAPAFLGRQWLFSEDHTFLGVDLVAASVTEAAMFALSLVLAIDGDLPGAVRLLVPLYEWTQTRAPQLRRSQGFLRFSDTVRDLLLQVRYRQLMDLYEREVVDRITDRGVDGAAHECESLADECTNLSRTPGSLDLAKSTLAFHFGRIDDALRLVESSRACSPADPAPFLSRAFLALWARDYSRVGPLYRQAERRGPWGTEMLFQVVRFLQAVHAQNSGRQELLFALAVVNEHLDRGLARQDFESFLAATACRDDLGPIRAEAGRRLASLSEPAISS